jgi:DNA-binding NarL/FixJ family response regulator
VKVHVRNIMKKLKATNRTHAVYLTRGLFEGPADYQSA